MTTRIDDPSTSAAETESKNPQPQVQVEPRRLGLNDFLKTLIKINGSDLHLQEGSVPMIRVDGRARFLDCEPPDAGQMEQFVKELVKDPDRWETMDRRGAVDVSCDTSS